MENETQKQHSVRPGEVVIEIDNEHLHVKEEMVADDFDPFNPLKATIRRTEVRAGNCHHLFPPVESRRNGTNFIRSRRELIRDGEDARFTMDPALRGIDFIPGERIHLDPVKKLGRITDACFDIENNEMYQRLLQVAAKLKGPRMFFVPGEYHEVDLRDPEAYWTWAFWMRRIMDGDKEHGSGPDQHKGCCTKGPRFCRPVQNTHLMPTLDEIANSLHVVLPCPLYANPDKQKAWEERRKKDDPNYIPQDGSQIVLTPWLAGTGK